MIHASYLILREVDCSWTSEESQITPAVFRMNIRKNPGTSQRLFVIPTLVRWHSQVHPKFSPALWRAPTLIPITLIVLLYQSSEIPVTPIPVVSDPSYSEGLPEYPPRVWYSPEIDASKFTLHILSDTPGVFQRLKYILLMTEPKEGRTCRRVKLVLLWPKFDIGPMPAEKVADPYWDKIEEGNHGVYKDLVRSICMCDRTPTIEQRMENLTALDMSLNKSQPRRGPNTTTTTKASDRKIESMKGGKSGTAGLAKDDGLTCYNWGQVGHISCDCPNRDLMKNPRKSALIGKDAPIAISGRPLNHRKQGGPLTGRKECGRLTHVKEGVRGSPLAVSMVTPD